MRGVRRSRILAAHHHGFALVADEVQRPGVVIVVGELPEEDFAIPEGYKLQIVPEGEPEPLERL